MMLTSPAKDFFVRAVVNAKQLRLKELNEIETELMIVEHEFWKSQGELYPSQASKIHSLLLGIKQGIRNKKQQI